MPPPKPVLPLHSVLWDPYMSQLLKAFLTVSNQLGLMMAKKNRAVEYIYLRHNNFAQPVTEVTLTGFVKVTLF